MEMKILNALKYEVTIASSRMFSIRYLKAAHAFKLTRWITAYIIERMLQEYSMLQFLPSLIAASAVYIARKSSQNCSGWSATLQYYTQYDAAALQPCLAEMESIFKGKTILSTVKKKYSSMKYGSVATNVQLVFDIDEAVIAPE